jgi:hypothetical protein
MRTDHVKITCCVRSPAGRPRLLMRSISGADLIERVVAAFRRCAQTDPLANSGTTDDVTARGSGLCARPLRSQVLRAAEEA